MDLYVDAEIGRLVGIVDQDGLWHHGVDSSSLDRLGSLIRGGYQGQLEKLGGEMDMAGMDRLAMNKTHQGTEKSWRQYSHQWFARETGMIVVVPQVK